MFSVEIKNGINLMCYDAYNDGPYGICFTFRKKKISGDYLAKKNKLDKAA